MNISMKWLAALLFISLAANIYFFGGYLGHDNAVLRHGIMIQEVKSDNQSRFSMRQLTRGLPADVRKQIGDAIKENRESLHALSKEQAKLRKETIDLLSAEKLDVEALSLIFERQRVISGEIQAPAHEALLKILPTVDQATRQEMVRKIRETMREQRKNRNKTTSPRKREQEKKIPKD